MVAGGCRNREPTSFFDQSDSSTLFDTVLRKKEKVLATAFTKRIDDGTKKEGNSKNPTRHDI